MNSDIYKIFEAYKTNIVGVINENVPVEIAGGYEGFGAESKPTFPELSKGKYDLTPEETQEVYKRFLTDFRSKGGKSPKLYKDFYEAELAPVIRAVKPSINNTNAKYSSRVLYNGLKEAGILIDERDGGSGVKMERTPSTKGVEKLANFTFKNAEDLGEEEAEETETETPITSTETKEAGAGIDDPSMKRFWNKIYGEGEYSRKELVDMFIQDNPDIEESESKMNISSLISTGYLKRTGSDTFTAVDPEEQEEKSSEEGEGSGEITSGIDDEDLEDWGLKGDEQDYVGQYMSRVGSYQDRGSRFED